MTTEFNITLHYMFLALNLNGGKLGRILITKNHPLRLKAGASISSARLTHIPDGLRTDQDLNTLAVKIHLDVS